MEFKISELMELIEEDTVRFERRNDVSPQKIKETVMTRYTAIIKLPALPDAGDARS